MKCYRVLYTQDNTAFMLYAENEADALLKARSRNLSELDESDFESERDYLVDEFTVNTNGTGILAFYDCYAVHERKNIAYKDRIKIDFD